MPSQPTPYESTPEDRKRGYLLGAFYALLAIVLGTMLFVIWPPFPWPADANTDREAISKALADCNLPTPTPTPTANPSESPAAPRDLKSAPVAMPINFSFIKKCVMTSFDERLLLLVIVAGMLGSFVHVATSLADYLGNNRFSSKWTWWYLLRPAIGGALALVFYFVIRGGFLTTSVGATDINPYGIAALAGLVGMFSKQATDKLSEVFSTLFKSGSGEGDEKRENPLKPKPTTITLKVDPPEVVAGSDGLEITVTGTDFVEGCKIFLDDSEQPTTFQSATQLSAQVSKDTVATPGILKLTVVNGSTKSAPVDFTVTAANPAPSVESVDPAQVTAGSTAQTVTVTGAGFIDGSKVVLNDQPQETTFAESCKLTARLADGLLAAPATLELTVMNPGGKASTAVDFVVT